MILVQKKKKVHPERKGLELVLFSDNFPAVKGGQRVNNTVY